MNRGPQKFRGHAGIDFDDAIERAKLGAKMGAPMTMIQNICYPEGRLEWERIYKKYLDSTAIRTFMRIMA